jgi:hypothetical protein
MAMTLLNIIDLYMLPLALLLCLLCLHLRREASAPVSMHVGLVRLQLSPDCEPRVEALLQKHLLPGVKNIKV